MLFFFVPASNLQPDPQSRRHSKQQLLSGTSPVTPDHLVQLLPYPKNSATGSTMDFVNKMGDQARDTVEVREIQIGLH